MKILFISHSSGLSGAERQLLQTLEAIKEKKTLLIPKSGLLEEKAKPFVDEVIKIPYSWWVVPQKIPIENKLARNLSRSKILFLLVSQVLNSIALMFLMRKDFDMVWTNTSVVPLGGVLSRIKKLPHIWHIHEILKGNPDIFSPIGEKIFSLIEIMSENIIAVSKRCAEQFKKREKVRVIYNSIKAPPVDLEKLILERKAKEEKIIGVIGNITRRKNQIMAVKIAEKLKDMKVKLFLAGKWDEDYKKEIDKFIEEKRIKNVFFLGFVDNIWDVLRKIDILFITSKVEVNPISALEAMAFGVPVISTNFEGAYETIKAGFIVESEEEMLEKTIELLKNEELLISLSRKAREEYEKNFSFERYKEEINSIIKLYKKED